MNQDKLMHFLVGALIVALMASVTVLWWAFLVSVVAGFCKELYDHFHRGSVEWLDFLCTVGGGLFASLFMWAVKT